MATLDDMRFVCAVNHIVVHNTTMAFICLTINYQELKNIKPYLEASEKDQNIDLNII
jgi:hypothetical protein